MKMMKRLVALSVAALGVVLVHAPAAAQDAANEPKVNQLIIYGEDKCPPSTDEEITVCARLDEGERYRIPKELRESDNPVNQSWTDKVRSFEAVGNFGPLSCTPVGAGGELGCTAKMIEAAYEEKANSSTVRFTELIAKARAERLSTIDQQAAETQSRVEQLEKQYDERVKNGESPAVAAAQSDNATASQSSDQSGN
jgi:hypothetical protein